MTLVKNVSAVLVAGSLVLGSAFPVLADSQAYSGDLMITESGEEIASPAWASVAYKVTVNVYNGLEEDIAGFLVGIDNDPGFVGYATVRTVNSETTGWDLDLYSTNEGVNEYISFWDQVSGNFSESDQVFYARLADTETGSPLAAHTQYTNDFAYLVAQGWTSPWAVITTTGSIYTGQTMQSPGGGGTTNPVPEPATMLLFGAGLAGLAGFGRGRSRN